MTPERCFKCDWFNVTKQACDRIFKARIRISGDAGEIVIETQPGILPKYMEEELSVYLATICGDLIDAWPGWAEIKRIRASGKECPGEQPSSAIKQYGRYLKLAKPLTPMGTGEAQPEKNLDAHGLFKSDISSW